MPWKELSIMDQKLQFIRDFEAQRHTLSDLCAMYGISRKTAYKWIERWIELGPEGLQDRSRQAKLVRNRTAPEVVQALLELRSRHPSWGAKKLRVVVQQRQPTLVLPSRSAICDILSRNGMVHRKPRRRSVGHPGAPGRSIVLPNDCWSADFKGQFRLGNGQYCYPLTVSDNCSRYLLGCRALQSTAMEPVRQEFTRLFHEYGLPVRIRTDNGTPFGAATLGRLSRLAVWWIRLGVMPEYIEPGRPQQNGRHERMHRTLKQEATKPPAASSVGQQRRFNAFRGEYNEQRPHEALDMKVPAQVYRPSARAMPSKLPQLEYPDRFEVRLVSANGGIRWRKHWVNLSGALIGQHVGLEEIGDGEWDVYFGPLKLGRLWESAMRIESSLPKLRAR